MDRAKARLEEREEETKEVIAALRSLPKHLERESRFVLVFIVFAYGYGLLLTSMAVALDELTFRRYQKLRDKTLLMLWVFLEQFGYRQLTVYWPLRGLVSFALGRKQWGRMERTGYEADADASV